MLSKHASVIIICLFVLYYDWYIRMFMLLQCSQEYDLHRPEECIGSNEDLGLLECRVGFHVGRVLPE